MSMEAAKAVTTGEGIEKHVAIIGAVERVGEMMLRAMQLRQRIQGGVVEPMPAGPIQQVSLQAVLSTAPGELRELAQAIEDELDQIEKMLF